MIIIPAIDLLDGKVVRLRHGNYDDRTEYPVDPVTAAADLHRLGALRIHIVDLNAARTPSNSPDRSQRRVNRPVLAEIRKKVPVLLEVGGGIRDEEDCAELLDAGVDRLILGTLLALKPELAASWVARWGRVFIGGIDAKEGEVKVAGWEAGTRLLDLDVARTAKEAGMLSVIYTNISRDGTLAGPDTERTIAVAKAGDLPVILSGGVSSLQDVRDLVEADGTGLVRGVITGKAYYEGKIDLAKAFAEFPQTAEAAGGF